MGTRRRYPIALSSLGWLAVLENVCQKGARMPCRGYASQTRWKTRFDARESLPRRRRRPKGIYYVVLGYGLWVVVRVRLLLVAGPQRRRQVADDVELLLLVHRLVLVVVVVVLLLLVI